MASSSRESRDENPIGDQSSRVLTTQRATEEITRDDPDEVSSWQGQSDLDESNEQPTIENIFGPLVERSKLTETAVDRLEGHYHISSRYQLMVPNKGGRVVHPFDGYIAIYKEFL